ncbi:MAG: allophanate hydrolase [Rhodobacterales bacterium]|nr:allophanate hydrolase [Rhodobacterales bacterium]
MLPDQSFQIADLHTAYAAGLDPDAVMDETFRRIAAADDPGIFLHLLDRDDVAAQVAKLGPFDPVAKPLWGLPFAIKDNIDAAGAPTTAACPAFTYTAEKDAFVVKVLKAAGAVLIGKTNLDQFATGLVGVRTPYPVPRNVFDPKLVPGGSSSGSAVAVARGLVTFALGTDTAGSGRVPAGLNGIIGLKPTLGALSNTGVVPACRTLDTVSVFALSVADAYGVFAVASRQDPDDAYTRPVPVPPLGLPASRFIVGVPDERSRPFYGDRNQAIAFEAALENLSAMGGSIFEIDFTPFYDVAEMLYEGAWVAERHTVVQDLMDRDPEALHPATRQVIARAEAFSATDAFRGFYRLQDMRRDLAPVIAGCDLLCVPTMPTYYSLADLAEDPITPNNRLGTYTNFVNLLDLCGLAVPTRPRPDGLPGSVTLLARAGHESTLAAVGAAMHRRRGGQTGTTGWPLAPVNPAPPGPAADEVAVAAVGAHMAGLPLNGQLTRLGGRFLYAGSTAPRYRLYRLAGGPPERPGLVRIPDGEDGGSAIALEVWALPRARLADFMAGIPQPLGLGTVSLEDGTAVTGFICEPAGLAGAQDITEFGGWRAFLDSR